MISPHLQSIKKPKYKEMKIPRPSKISYSISSYHVTTLLQILKSSKPADTSILSGAVLVVYVIVLALRDVLDLFILDFGFIIKQFREDRIKKLGIK